MNETGLVMPSALAIPDLLVDPLNPPPGFPSITPLTGRRLSEFATSNELVDPLNPPPGFPVITPVTGSGSWFPRLSETAGSLFSAARSLGSRIAANTTSAFFAAGTFVAAHPIGVGVVAAAVVLSGILYYGHRHANNLEVENREAESNQSQIV